MKSFVQGIKNFWYFRKVIWNFRWYDYGYLMDLWERSFEYLDDKWSESHYIGFEEDHERIKKIINKFKKIKELEEECSIEADKEAQRLIHELGEDIFGYDEKTIEDNGKKHKTKVPFIQRLWD
jgi:hypothetical protein